MKKPKYVGHICKRATCKGCPKKKPYPVHYYRGEPDIYCCEVYGSKLRDRGVPHLVVREEEFGSDHGDPTVPLKENLLEDDILAKF